MIVVPEQISSRGSGVSINSVNNFFSFLRYQLAKSLDCPACFGHVSERIILGFSVDLFKAL